MQVLIFCLMAQYGVPSDSPSRRAELGAGSAVLNISEAIESLLVEGEQVIRRGGVAPQYLDFIKWFYIVINVILVIITVGIWLFIAPFFYLHWLWLKRVRWYITDRRLIAASGLFGMKTQEIGFSRFGEANLTQGVFSRLFNTGTVRVTDVGSNSIVIPLINNPLEVKKLLSQKAYENK